jgi:starch synthase
MMDGLKVLFVAAEASGLIKVGGLGDVAGELPARLADMGAEVRMAIPCYQDMQAPVRYLTDFPVPMGYKTETCIVREAEGTRLQTYLIDSYRYFGRPGVYGHYDDSERFTFFCLALFELLKRMDFIPDIIHLNDWHTAPLAMLLRERSAECPKLCGTAVLYTIHNLEYQGICGKDIFYMCGVGDSVFTSEKVEYYGCFNPMKAGLAYADALSSVSQTYCKEMTTESKGFGLEGMVAKRFDALRGILNGIDTIAWNPETDPEIYRNYSADTLIDKHENRLRLQEELGLVMGENPLCGVVTRLTLQKGTGLLIDSAESILRQGGQIVVLGSGEGEYEQALRKLSKKYAGRFAAVIGFDARLARRIYAASDIFIMPSRIEPCGIAQLIAMRYGAVPFVHHTGGLADTVVDEITFNGSGTGFSFPDFSLQFFIVALKKVFLMYRKDPKGWEALVKRCMKRDSSWDQPALSYLKLYEEVVEVKRVAVQEGRKEYSHEQEPICGE